MRGKKIYDHPEMLQSPPVASKGISWLEIEGALGRKLSLTEKSKIGTGNLSRSDLVTMGSSTADYDFDHLTDVELEKLGGNFRNFFEAKYPELLMKRSHSE